jgi:hypothetical protein
MGSSAASPSSCARGAAWAASAFAAWAIPRRGVLSARGRRVRARRGGLRGGAARGVAAGDGFGALLVLLARVARIRVDPDGAQPVVGDLEQHLLAVDRPLRVRVIGGAVHADHQVLLEQRLRHLLPRAGRQPLGRAGQVLGVPGGGGEDRALRVGKLHRRGLRFGTR